MGGCCAETDGLLSYEQALERLLAAVTAVAGDEEVGLGDALGRILAAPLRSPIAVPGWDNSAMDGYAVRCSDLAAGVPLAVSQRIPAGSAPPPLRPGTVARIFTGAPIPAGADAVVMQEQCHADGDHVAIDHRPTPGEQIRRAGTAIAAGAEVLAAGTRLRAQQIGVAASVGAARLRVRRRLRVAVLSTGDELAEPGAPLAPGQIYNSNRYQLGALCRDAGCEPLDLGIVADTLEATVAALEHAAASADLILTSGGVSVGEEDHLRAAIERLGRLDLWRVRMKPGKPLAFGEVRGTPILGLPGNPVSVFVTFCLFARPYLLRRAGANDGPVAPLQAVAGFTRAQPGARREFLRARIEPVDGVAVVRLFPNQDSSVLTSVAWGDGLAVALEGRSYHPGDPIAYLPFGLLLG